MSWRRYVLDGPARVTDWLLFGFRIYLSFILLLFGPLLMLAVFSMLALWWGFGIRWGW